jgi:hypothetical protein
LILIYIAPLKSVQSVEATHIFLNLTDDEKYRFAQVYRSDELLSSGTVDSNINREELCHAFSRCKIVPDTKIDTFFLSPTYRRFGY